MKSSIAALAVLAVTLPAVAHAEYRADTRASSEIRPSRKTPTALTRSLFTQRQERTAGERLAVSTAPEIPQTLSVDAVLSKINTVYMAGMQRCYRKQLAVDPSVAGKVTVLFSVNAKGGVVANLDGINEKLDACLTRAIGNWRFPHASEPSEATFKVSLVLSK